MANDLFIGRRKELQGLSELLKKKTASLVVVKGRRRIGKSRLLQEFGQGQRTLKFIGLPPDKETTRQKELNEFSRQLSVQTALPEVQVNSWGKLFELLATQVQNGPVVLIFDEISWMGSEDSEFLGHLKTTWDELFKRNPDLILILCGSISSWIDENILNGKGFFGRISWSIDLDPLPLRDCNALLEAKGFRGSNYEKFKILAVTGGVPWYLEQIQGHLSADDNIRRQCFTESGSLVNEFDRIFHEIFGKRDKLYREIVKTLAQGPCEYEKIVESTGYESSGRLSAYLSDLNKAGFISRDFVWSLSSGKTSKMSQFRLSDNYLRFYLKYVEPRLDAIHKGRFDEISIASLPGWDAIMALQFENLVLANRNDLLLKLGIRFEEIISDNPYFQRKTKHRLGCQIDYLVQTRYKNIYLCEIKFSKNPISKDVIAEVQEKIKRLKVPAGCAVLPVLIHVNGVSEAVLESQYFYKIIDFGDFIA
ncbi:MAG: ATP-binding protein [Myxococcaceae bacterium]